MTGAVVPPIHLTSTFAFRGFGDKRSYDYTRSGNPDARSARRRRSPISKAAPAPSSRLRAWPRSRWSGYLMPVGRAHRRAARLLWRHVSPVRRLAPARRAARSSSSTSATRPRYARRCRSRPRCCGSRRRAIRCCASRTSRSSRRSATRAARWWSWTTRSCRRRGSSR